MASNKPSLHVSPTKGRPSEVRRPCKEHTFLTHIDDVRNMEEGLLKLLDDFNSGKLLAFGSDCPYDKLDSVREQQEKLMRLHFALDQKMQSGPSDGKSKKQARCLMSEDDRQKAKANLSQLVTKLESLSFNIHNLHNSHQPRR